MIDLSQDILVVLILGAIFCGAALGVLNDCIKIFKSLIGIGFKPSKKRSVSFFAYIITFFTDLIFWVAAGILSIALLYGVGGGVFRGIAYFAMAVGYLVYYFTLGRLVRTLSEGLVKLLRKILHRLLNILSVPIKKLFDGIIFLYHLTIGKFIGKIKEALRSRIEKKRETAKIADFSECEEIGGKEELVYVDGRTGYRKEGRISFDARKRE